MSLEAQMTKQHLQARAAKSKSETKTIPAKPPRSYARIVERPHLRMYCRKHKAVKFNDSTYAQLQKSAAAHFALPWDQIMHKTRKTEIVEMRRMIFAASVELMNAKNPDLQVIGGGAFERTTMRHAIEVHKDWMRVSPNIDYCKKYRQWLQVLTQSLSTITTR